MTRRLLSYIGLVLAMAATTFAQQGSTGAITGTVADPSGQVVPGATVKLTSEQSGEERSATTNEVGDFAFLALQPGPYSARGIRRISALRAEEQRATGCQPFGAGQDSAGSRQRE